MSAEDSDIKQWPDPKDYGLPVVEIIPLRSKIAAENAGLEESTSLGEIAVPILDTDSPAAAVTNSSETPVKREPEFSEKKVQRPVSNKIEQKKSSAWVWAVVVITLGIVSVIIWQIMANGDTVEPKPAFEIVENESEIDGADTGIVDSETTAADQNQTSVNQDTIQALGNSNPNLSKPAESGTTIANTATGNLIRIESKTERAQYFIIVGSLPNEKMALSESSQYLGRSGELYLIAPFDGGKNYRLALAKFDSFKMASAKLEEIKSQYTEELWILKY